LSREAGLMIIEEPPDFVGSRRERTGAKSDDVN
jgi:hypothetical protein